MLLQENGKNPNWEPGVRQEIVATEPDKIERLQEQPKKDLPSSGPKQSFPFRKELPDEFGSDPCLSFADSRQPLLPKDGRTGKQYFLQPSLLRQLREPPRSDLGRSGSKEAIALERLDELQIQRILLTKVPFNGIQTILKKMLTRIF